MAGLVDNSKKDEEEVELPPYPIPRHIRTRRPWRVVLCSLFLILSAGFLFYGFADVVFDPDEGARLSKQESLRVQIADARASNSSTKADDSDVHSPKAMGDTIATAQNEMMMDPKMDEATLAECVSKELPYMGSDLTWAGPWFWNKEAGNNRLSWSFLTPLTFEGNSQDVAWGLFYDDFLLVVVKAKYVVSKDTSSLTDLVVEPTSIASHYAEEAPENITKYTSDAKWLEAHIPKQSAIQKAVGSSDDVSGDAS